MNLCSWMYQAASKKIRSSSQHRPSFQKLGVNQSEFPSNFPCRTSTYSSAIPLPSYGWMESGVKAPYLQMNEYNTIYQPAPAYLMSGATGLLPVRVLTVWNSRMALSFWFALASGLALVLIILDAGITLFPRMRLFCSACTSINKMEKRRKRIQNIDGKKSDT